MLYTLLLFLGYSLFSPKQAVKQVYHLDGYAQGTTYSITYYATDSTITRQRISQKLAEIDASLSLYVPQSLINQFNHATRGVVADQHLRLVVHKALQVYRDTDGHFDATVEPLVRAWGFGAQHVEAPPAPATIQALLLQVGSDKIHLRGDSLVKDQPGVHLDLNGIAQGYTVDVLAELLEQQHIHDYLVELGGEIRVRGRKWPSGEPMRIGIERPDTTDLPGAGMRQIIRLPAGGVTTSGNYRKFKQWGSVKSAHLINPKTGYAFQNEMVSVTVIARDAMTADAYDNALMGMGLTKALTFLKRHRDLQAYLIYQRPDGAMADTSTLGFQKLIVQQ
ncbi:FAD:protein FMN transferase [Hymenobacter sp. GOD-10R]|uniref:FAD:protein FMN transferase n=1 Tax=Hymenobacter sp. GOD-10R TaxID=3093922 RepID=UPI002D79B959|nr:FAD:protein FMN transferase [Hymenobacter sp. GOD-10R]WRQ30287.1 FAD:protein FMN transferase [Hymenobacter sp. GOD-10R]